MFFTLIKIGGLRFRKGTQFFLPQITKKVITPPQPPITIYQLPLPLQVTRATLYYPHSHQKRNLNFELLSSHGRAWILNFFLPL